MGGIFWLAVIGLGLFLLSNLYTAQLSLSPLLVYSTILLIWNILFSPYGNSSRMLGPYGVAICVLGLRTLWRDDLVVSLKSRFANPGRYSS